MKEIRARLEVRHSMTEVKFNPPSYATYVCCTVLYHALKACAQNFWTLCMNLNTRITEKLKLSEKCIVDPT